ncbi:MAG: DUF4280 domain-containing protein [Niabella sp.]|nr:DUF4280 domain-containing protein [Niabella sp.]
MPQKLTDTASLSCDKGTSPSQLAVTSQSFCYASEKLVATEQDKQANINIKAFGICSTTRKACIPQPINWLQTTPKDQINGYKIITEESYCMCALGGKITIQQKGHNGLHEIE